MRSSLVLASLLCVALTANAVSLHKVNKKVITDISAWEEPESPGAAPAEPAGGDGEVVSGEAEAVYRPPPKADVSLLKEYIRVEGDPSQVALEPVVDDEEYEEDPSAAPKAFKLKNTGAQPIVLALEDNALNNYKLRLEKTAAEGIMPLHPVRTRKGPDSVYQALVPKPTYEQGASGLPEGFKMPPPKPEDVIKAATAAAKDGADVNELIAAVKKAAGLAEEGAEVSEEAAEE